MLKAWSGNSGRILQIRLPSELPVLPVDESLVHLKTLTLQRLNQEHTWAEDALGEFEREFRRAMPGLQLLAAGLLSSRLLRPSLFESEDSRPCNFVP